MAEFTMISGVVFVSLAVKSVGIFVLAYLGARLAIRHERPTAN